MDRGKKNIQFKNNSNPTGGVGGGGGGEIKWAK